jgi:hypothetical protein
MRYAQVIHTESRIIHTALCAVRNAKKSIMTDTVLSADVMNAPKQEVHGKLKIVFKER